MNPVRGIETTAELKRGVRLPNFQINESRSRDWNKEKENGLTPRHSFQINESRSRDWNSNLHPGMNALATFQINESRSRDWN